MPPVSLGLRLLLFRSISKSPLSAHASDNEPIWKLVSVGSEPPGRNRGIVLWLTTPFGYALS
jgi:hypothetical protein